VAKTGAFLLKIKRGETPLYRRLRSFGYALFHANLPVPRPLRPALASLYDLHFLIRLAFRTFFNFVYCEPLFRARCEQVGKRLHLALLPRIMGHPRIRVGNDVQIHGRMTVIDAGSGVAELIIEDGAQIGHCVTFLISRQVVVGRGAGISSECFISDVDSSALDTHPGSAIGLDAAPVRIAAQAWIGRGSCILKGVNIGEASMVGVASVVAIDVPPRSVAMGNPARIIKRARSEPDPASTVSIPFGS
jgi:acetyltransferase-like isoleucine patch superfamily enzyme